MTTQRTLLPMMLFCVICAAGLRAQEPGEQTRQIEVLKSNAGQKAKADACRRLALVGTKDCVPALAGLLGDEKLAHMARYALEPIPDDAVDKALRKALATLKGRPLVGVIGSVGVRRDATTVDALAAFLGSSNSEVVEAAARALGRIGTDSAATHLESALKGAAKATRPDVIEGLFRCAETLDAADRRPRALAIYEKLLGLGALPRQVYAGALRGVILAKGDAGLPMLVKALHSKEFSTVGAAARVGQELPGTKATEALAEALGKLQPDTQVVLALTLAKRGDPAALPALNALAGEGETAARVAAIRAVTEVGDASATPILISLQADGDEAVAEAARGALAAMAGAEADAALLGMLEQGKTEARIAAAELIGRRRMAGAVPALLTASADANASVRAASLKALGELAGPAEFPALIDRLMKAKSPAESKACEQALTSVCRREARPDAARVTIKKALYGDLPDGKSRDVSAKVAAMMKSGEFAITASNGSFGDPTPGTRKSFRLVYSVNGFVTDETVAEQGTIEIRAGAAPPALAAALCEAMKGATGNTKLALLGVLRYAGGEKALAAARAAVTDADAEVQKGAVAILCSWPTPDALPELLRFAATAGSTRDKVLALRGCCRLVPAQTVPHEEKVSQLKDILAMCERTDEKRLAISSLGTVPSPDAMAVVLPYLEEPRLKEEACLAAVGIAEATERSHGELAATVARRVLKTTGSKTTQRRARAVLRRLE
jgi:HEAT repeat protein